MGSPEVKARFQLSLRALLAFVIAVAVWLLLAKRATPNTRGLLVIGAIGACVLIGFIVNRLRKRSLILLLFLFLLVVFGYHSVMLYSERVVIPRLQRRVDVIATIRNGLIMYSTDFGEFPPPSKELDKSATELFAYLCTRNGKMGPYLPSNMPFRGAFGSKLIYVKDKAGKYLVIDTGDDNLPGGTIDGNGIYTPMMIDANYDGRDDGDDDISVTVNKL